MRKINQFGGSWTEDKLNRLRKYLSAYTTIFTKNQKARYYKTVYVDAFAGTGYRSAYLSVGTIGIFPELEEEDTQKFLKGSAIIALETEPSFNQYLLIERDPEKVEELQKLKEKFPHKEIKVINEDANIYLKKWCQETDWCHFRAVVFLDPYGMEVDWSLIEAIGKTQAIDLWILFPLGIAVNRLLTHNNLPPPEWERALTRIFGTEEWKEAFYSHRKEATLFGEQERYIKDADFDIIGKFFIDRLKTVFYRVAENPLPLRNSRSIPIYLLCFAAGNPKGADIVKDF